MGKVNQQKINKITANDNYQWANRIYNKTKQLPTIKKELNLHTKRQNK